MKELELARIRLVMACCYDEKFFDFYQKFRDQVDDSGQMTQAQVDRLNQELEGADFRRMKIARWN